MKERSEKERERQKERDREISRVPKAREEVEGGVRQKERQKECSHVPKRIDKCNQGREREKEKESERERVKRQIERKTCRQGVIDRGAPLLVSLLLS